MCTAKKQTQTFEKEKQSQYIWTPTGGYKIPRFFFFFPRKFFISAALFLNRNPGSVIFSLLHNEVHCYKFSYSRVENCKELKNESSNSL